MGRKLEINLLNSLSAQAENSNAAKFDPAAPLER